ncbi:MAG: discoidin domain-containing protein [Spirochaetales bacterium]|nr:discoidin domain-containing protein [Spirochaetales bacterium]
MTTKNVIKTTVIWFLIICTSIWINAQSPLKSDITDLGGTVSAQYTDSPSGEDILKLIDNTSATKYLTFHASGWVQYQADHAYIVNGYTITSANDYEERDPLTWTLQGSLNGSSWATMDSRSGEDFTDRFQTKSFTFSNSTAYSYYRLNMTNNSGTILQLAEWELSGSLPVTPTPTPSSPASTPTGLADITNSSGSISAQYYDSPSGEEIDKLIDNSSSTKYLTFHASGWVQFQAASSYVVTGYSITSANDAAERDPLSWTLQGSANGSTWTTLDSRNGEDFPNRFQLREFSFTNSNSFNYYRLNMNNNSGTILQIAEWALFGNGGSTVTGTPTATPTPTPSNTRPPNTPTPTPTTTEAPATYSDNFNDNAIGSAWSFCNGTWNETGSILRQDSSAQGDPCKAILSNSGLIFNGNQMILAKVYVDSWTDGDHARAGVSLFTGTGNGLGYNLLFHENHSTIQWLDDMVAWGPGYTFSWSNRTWYWFRVKMEDGTLYGKVWQEGSAEPASWAYSWTRSGRTGYPALNGGASGTGSCTVFFDDITVTSSSSSTNTPVPTSTPLPTTPGGIKSFYTTNVDDGLDTYDRTLFENEFSSMGYSFLGRNTNVSASQLNTLMGRSDIGILYHTGHGLEGGIAASDGILYVGSVSGINNNTFISATCLTLTDTNWRNKMNTSCSYVFGYTNVSYDGIDNDVVSRFAGSIRSGTGYGYAWYYSNAVEGLLSDRWCEYVRENGTITEYSARTGRIPAQSKSELIPLNEAENLTAVSGLLSDKRTFSSEFARIRENEFKIRERRRITGGFYGNTDQFLKKVPIQEENAVRIAGEWIKTDLPQDASLDTVTPVTATSGDGGTQIVAYIVKYKRTIDGLAIRSNGVGDQITILVNDNGVTALSRVWPEITITARPGAIPQESFLDLETAIQTAAIQISHIIKTDLPVTITAVNPCYGSTETGIVPAYEMATSIGSSFIVNAVTGALIF